MKDKLLAAARADAIPAGESGAWSIKKLSLAKPFPVQRPSGPYTIPPGHYTQLFRMTNATMHTHGECVMNDMPDELNTHLDFMLKASGRILITGLGLGCVTRGCLANPNVEHITLIERDRHVIEMVMPHMPTTHRLTLVVADALKWAENTSEEFDCAWHDLWTDTSAEQPEPHLQVVHAELMTLMDSRVKNHHGIWAMPRYFRRRFGLM